MLHLLSLPFRWLWRFWFFINGFITFLILFPLFYLLLRSRRWFPHVFRLQKLWAHLILFGAGITYSIFKKPALQERPYIFCPNHFSYLDIVMIYACFPVYFHTMGKAELKRVPLFNNFFKRMNIPVNRSSHRDAHRAYLRTSEDLSKGISVTLFPEGGIHNTAPQLYRFKNGPFRLAIEKQVPIVPVSFLNNWKILPDYKFYRNPGRPGKALVIIHEPIETTGMSENDLEALKQKVYDIIQEPILKYELNERGNQNQRS